MHLPSSFALAGIHTGIGKTVVAAVMAEALRADYWKPLQAGLDGTDSNTVRALLSNGTSVVHPERYALCAPMSPHAAAALEGITVQLDDFKLPGTSNQLIVETAGGLLSPVTARHTAADLIAHLGLPLALVSQAYLGSINHTLLCLETLRYRGLRTLGIIFNGTPDAMSESFIRDAYPAIPIAHVPLLEPLDAASVAAFAPRLAEQLALWHPA